jgi:hypothetical protein
VFNLWWVDPFEQVGVRDLGGVDAGEAFFELGSDLNTWLPASRVVIQDHSTPSPIELHHNGRLDHHDLLQGGLNYRIAWQPGCSCSGVQKVVSPVLQ